MIDKNDEFFESSKEIEAICNKLYFSILKFIVAHNSFPKKELADEAIGYTLLQLCKELQKANPNPATKGDLKTAEGKNALFFWMRLVARRYVIDFFRVRRRRDEMGIKEVSWEDVLEGDILKTDLKVSDDWEPGYYIPLEEHRKRIMENVVYLKLENCTVEEIAGECKISVAQVRTLWMRFKRYYWRSLLNNINFFDGFNVNTLEFNNTLYECKFTLTVERAITLYHEGMVSKGDCSFKSIEEQLEEEGMKLTKQQFEESLQKFVEVLRRKGKG